MEKYVHVRRGVFVWLVTMAFLSPFLMSVAGFWYTNRVQRESEQRWMRAQKESEQIWCGTLNAIDFPGRKVDPGPAGEVIRRIRIQRQIYGCDAK